MSIFHFQTFHTPSFGDEEFVDVPLLNPMQQQHHHYQMDPQHQYQQDVTQNMGLLDDQQNQYTLWNPDSQQMYINSNEYDLQTNSQMYYPDTISNNQQIQSEHNNMMMPPPQKSPQVTSPINPFIGQSPHAYGENGTTSDDSDDSVVRGANSLKRPSPEPLSDRMSATNASKVAKVTTVKKPKVQRKRKKKDPNEPQKPVSAYALFFRDTQAAIKGQNPNASFGEVSTIVASMWDVLAPEHKDVYKKKTEAAKAVYLKTLAAYRASVVSKGTDLESPPPTQPQLVQHSPHSQMSSVSPKPHASPQPISQGLPIQHPNQQQNQYMATQQSQVPSQHIQHNNYVQYTPQVDYMQQHHQPMQQHHQPMQQHLQPMHQMNNSNINQNHMNYGYDHNQQHHNQQHSNQLMESNGYHMQTMQSNQHNSHHVADGVDQLTPTPNNAYHHQSNIQQKCIRNGCTNQAITSPDWEDEYCSNECVINHCGDVFGNWIQKNGQQQQSYSAVK